MLLSWLTPIFFIDVITKDLGHQEGTFRIEDLHRTNVTTQITTWDSDIHLAHMEVTSDCMKGYPVHVSYFVKERIVNEEPHSVQSSEQFEKETIIYRDLLPAFERMFNSSITFGPKFFKHVTTPHDILVLENVRSKGFGMHDSYKRFNLEDSIKILSILAQFHAASAVYHSQHGAINESFKEGLFGESSADAGDQTVLPYYKPFVESLESRNYSSEILDLIRQWDQNPVSAISKMLRYNPDRFNVLNQGKLSRFECPSMYSPNHHHALLVRLEPSLSVVFIMDITKPENYPQLQIGLLGWANNVLFRGDELRMMNFEEAFWGNPSIDVLLLLFNAVKVEVVVASFDDLISFYYQELARNLKQLNYSKPIPTLEDIRQDISRYGFVGASQLQADIPLNYYTSYANPEESNFPVQMDNPEGYEYLKAIFEMEELQNEIGPLLNFAYERGFLQLPRI
ncbi:uncharacterized protein LOC129760047 [Uranotaenia lowii]|uniref:uncharacterized protein LOC129760047 n=1 Tax=Uranotaenia lowii TaxID=190385 RepID=UPI00247A8ED4|nr:uncharacterized protein LOC129760047 [Uranotaenia lowii]